MCGDTVGHWRSMADVCGHGRCVYWHDRCIPYAYCTWVSLGGSPTLTTKFQTELHFYSSDQSICLWPQPTGLHTPHILADQVPLVDTCPRSFLCNQQSCLQCFWYYNHYHHQQSKTTTSTKASNIHHKQHQPLLELPPLIATTTTTNHHHNHQL